MMAALHVAFKEFADGVRNRWFISITAVFAVLSLGLTFFGSAVSGTLETASMATIISSLSSLAVFLIPLIALLLSYDAFVGEQEQGTLLLLLTYPLSRGQLFLGKLTGLGAIIALATFIGFGISGFLLFLQNKDVSVLFAFGQFIVSAIILGLCFIAIAFVISLVASEKSKAAGLALISWFFFALVYDLALLATLVGGSELISQELLQTLMLFNPTDVFRLINTVSLQSDFADSSMAATIGHSLSALSLYLILVVWVFVPALLAVFLLRKKAL